MSRRIVPSRRARSTIGAAAILVVGLVALLAANPAGAEEEISIAPDSVVVGEPGSVSTVATADVPTELVGSECDLNVRALNGVSTHPGTTLIVSTGSTREVVPDVEGSPGGSVVTERRVVLGERISLEIKLGPEGISSLGFTAGFDCPPVPAGAQVTTDPTVLPAQQLPPTPPAAPVAAQPTYTG